MAKDVIDRVRDSDDDAEFLPLWPAASEHGEHDVSVKVLAEDTADAMTEDMLTIATLVLGGAMAELTWDDDQDASNRIRTAIEPRILSLNDAVNDGEPFNPETVLSELGKRARPGTCDRSPVGSVVHRPICPIRDRYQPQGSTRRHRSSRRESRS